MIFNIFKRINNTINVLKFSPGDKVVLINDPKQEVYIVEALVRNNRDNFPNISRGPMRQLPPSLVYRVQSEKWGGISNFRSDSIELKSQTAVERQVSRIKQQIKDVERKIIKHEHKIKKKKRKLELLQRELTYWEKEPEHVV